MGLVIERGRAMAAMREGGMAALLGAELAVAEEVCREITASGAGTVVVANVNAPGQVVLSGATAALDAAVELARQRGVRRPMPPNPTAPFHSPLMHPPPHPFPPPLHAVPTPPAP